jgi:hypothetical protein
MWEAGQRGPLASGQEAGSGWPAMRVMRVMRTGWGGVDVGTKAGAATVAEARG